jgi:hypothetical protein
MLLSFLLVASIFLVAAGLAGQLGASEGITSESLLDFIRPSLFGLGLVVVGAAILAARLVQFGELEALPGVAVSYGIFLPLGALASGLLKGQDDLWLGALLTFSLHVAWSIVSALSTFIALGLRPPSRQARSFLGAVLLMSLVILLGMLSMGGTILAVSPVQTQPPAAVPADTSTPTGALTPSETADPSALASETPEPPLQPSATSSPTRTLEPSQTPTPASGSIYGTGGLGVMLRDGPNGPALGGLFDGTQVEVIGGPVLVEGVSWWQVKTRDGVVGWVLSQFLATATPPVASE